MRLLIPIVFTFFGIQNLKAQIDSLHLVWCSEKKLSWGDFKGTLADSSYADATAYSDVYIFLSSVDKAIENEERYNLEVLAIFSHINSGWKGRFTKELLAHEQLHFDITELVARKIRASLDGRIITNKNYNSILSNELYPRIEKLLTELNGQYDSETLNGLIRDEQERWVAKVKTELDELSKYQLSCKVSMR